MSKNKNYFLLIDKDYECVDSVIITDKDCKTIQNWLDNCKALWLDSGEKGFLSDIIKKNMLDNTQIEVVSINKIYY